MSSLPQALPDGAAWLYRAGAASLRISAPGFEAASPAPCAAEAAVVLDLAGELLDALDAAGLAPASPWQWAAQPGLPTGGARATWQGSQARATLTLPWAELRARTAPPQLPGLAWLPVAAECVLAQWRFDATELAALEPGGVVLIDAPCMRLRARGEPHAEGDLPWQLVGRWEQAVALEAVLGWQPGALPPPPATCLLVETAWPDAVLAHGRLLPWGSAQAFRIDSV